MTPGSIFRNGYGQEVAVLVIHGDLALVDHPDLGRYVVDVFAIMKFPVIGSIPESRRLERLPTWYYQAIELAGNPQITIAP